jgi:enterochelin esterase-like enzyme
VLPYVENEFRVIKDKKARAIMGYSMGGGHSTTIGFGHPELFSVVGGFSGYANAQSAVIARLLADPAKTNSDYKMIFLGSGTEDNAVNSGRALHAAFTEKGIKHVWREDPGYGHDYQIWRIYLRDLAQQLFRE